MKTSSAHRAKKMMQKIDLTNEEKMKRVRVAATLHLYTP
jgi:hypothetical protein